MPNLPDLSDLAKLYNYGKTRLKDEALLLSNQLFCGSCKVLEHFSRSGVCTPLPTTH